MSARRPARASLHSGYRAAVALRFQGWGVRGCALVALWHVRRQRPGSMIVRLPDWTPVDPARASALDCAHSTRTVVCADHRGRADHRSKSGSPASTAGPGGTVNTSRTGSSCRGWPSGDLARRLLTGDRGADLKLVGAEHLRPVWRQVVGVVLHEGGATLQSAGPHLHQPHQHRRPPKAVRLETLSTDTRQLRRFRTDVAKS